MNCKTVSKNLISYSNGELSNSENEIIKTHLKNCESCYNIYTEFEATLNLIEKKKTITPNPFIYTRIKQRLNNIENGVGQSGFRPVYRKVLQPVLLSFLLVSGVFIGIQLGNTYEIPRQEKLANQQTTEFYFNDLQQEKLEVLLLNE